MADNSNQPWLATYGWLLVGAYTFGSLPRRGDARLMILASTGATAAGWAAIEGSVCIFFSSSGFFSRGTPCKPIINVSSSRMSLMATVGKGAACMTCEPLLTSSPLIRAAIVFRGGGGVSPVHTEGV